MNLQRMKQLAGIKLNEDMNVGGSESDMQTADTDNRNAAYAEFDAGQEQATESAPPGMEKTVRDIKQEYPGHPEKAFATAWSIYNKKHGQADEGCMMDEDREYDLNFITSSIRNHYPHATSEQELKQMVAGETGYGNNPDFDNMFHSSLDHYLNGDDTSMDHLGDEDDYTDQSMRAGEMGMEEDLNNGYDTEKYATGSDFFPNGADSPVVTAVGPSGARQGDNPEQKKMQVAEVHKELVYGYRKFISESTKTK